MTENEKQFKAHNDFSFVAHDYKLISNKKNDQGNELIDKVVFLTKTTEIPRQRVTHNPEVEKEVRKRGKTVVTDGQPTLKEIEEKRPDLNKIIDALENGEYVQIEGTVTEIIPDDGSESHFSINKNHFGTVSGRVLSGEKREKWKKQTSGWKF